MKKIMAMVLVAAFMFTMTVGVFAEEPAKRGINPETKAKLEQIRLLKDELQAATAELKGLHEQIAAKRETIKSLLVTAKEAEETDKIEAAKAIRVELKAVNDELRALRETKKELKSTIKAAREAKDYDTMLASMTELLSYKGQGLNLLNQKSALLDEIISVLQ